jgi:hypothetical protein
MDIQFIKDVSVVIGLWLVFYKIAAWQIEHRGKRNIELAEETLALFYEAKDVIEWLRHPIGFSDENSSLVQGERENKEDFEARKRVNFIFYRYNQNKELFNKIHSLRYRFMAQIGKEQAKPFDELDSLIKQIVAAARLLIILWPENKFQTEDEKKKHYEQIKRNEKIIWDPFSDDDPIKLRLNGLIKNIESVCQDVIVAKGTLSGFLNSHLKEK